MCYVIFFFFNDTATTEIYTLSLHDALPISTGGLGPMPPAETPEANSSAGVVPTPRPSTAWRVVAVEPLPGMCLRVKFIDGTSDRKSTRLNSSHGYISYAVFCL